MKMLEKIAVYAIGIVVAIPVLLWFAIRGVFRGGWGLLTFVYQYHYRELKRICESGTAAELQAFLAAHPGAREYIVYTRQDRPTSIITSFFRLPAPLAVAGHANNMVVIPVLLENGASPEVRSVSESQSPAEEAIGDPDKMRALCGGKTWWLERFSQGKALQTENLRHVIWEVMRGARLTSVEHLYAVSFLRLPMVMKEFVCRFGIKETRRRKFLSLLKQISPKERERISLHRFHSPMGPRGVTLHKEFDEMMRAVEESLSPLPVIGEEALSRLLFSACLMGKEKMLELLDTLFTLEQQFAMLDRFTSVPPADDEHEQTEEAVDLLLCSILKKAGEKV